jgi:hypothetical protein
LLLLGFVLFDRGGSSGSASQEVGKYEQTWPIECAETTCAEWLPRSDSHERWAMAADFLLAGLRSDDFTLTCPAIATSHGSPEG